MPRKTITSEVEQAVNDTLSNAAGALQDALYECQNLEDKLEELLEQVKERKAVLERAVQDFGTP